MMKTNNEMSATPSYTAPVAKLINAKLEGLICQSSNLDGMNVRNNPFSWEEDDE